MFSVGDRVGDYQIVARLKSGGMATLFLARRSGASGFAKHVAIKVVHPHLAEDPSFVRMFVDEALLSARIHHPNVVHVEELRELDGSHYLVMEYVDGCSLAQLMRELARQKRRLTPDLAVHVAVRIADGLHAAHEATDEQGRPLGVVHRDVSPQNVLLAWQGHVKLIDFGVAKARDRSHQTIGASLKGKIRYMAPEQAHGKPADRRADVYALGVVLWEMLTMRRCFAADNDLALIDVVRNPAVPPPSTLVSEIPPELDAAVMRALAPRREDRLATAQLLRRALAEAMPRALVLDSSHLSELLHAVMGEQVRKSRAFLPDSLAGDQPPSAGGDEAEEVLKTMTVSQADLASFVDFPSDDGSREDVPPRWEGSAEARQSDLGAAPAPASAGRWNWIAAGAVAAAVLVLSAGAVALLSGEDEGPVVTLLEDPFAAVDAGSTDAEPLAVASPDAGSAIASEAPQERDPQDVADAEPPVDPRVERERRRDPAPRRPRETEPRRPRRTPMTSQMGSSVPLADDFGF